MIKMKNNTKILLKNYAQHDLMKEN